VTPTKAPLVEPFQRSEEASPRRAWPAPLRAIFWLSVSGLFIGTGQLCYFVLVRDELGPPPTLQGSYTLVVWAQNLVIFYAGLRSRRRLFVLSAAATSLLTFFVTGHFLAVILSGWFAAERFDPAFFASEIAAEFPTALWNLAVIVTAGVILAHLASTHLAVVGERRGDRPSPLPPPVELDAKRR
jgi:hypothetical protein